MLGRQDDGVEPDGLVAVVADGDLGLAVGAQVGDLAALADGGQALGQPVREVDRQRHQLGGVLAGVAEHQALVAGTLLVERVDATGAVLVGRVDALGDVGALLADRDLDAAGGPVEALGGGVVADAEHGVADDLGDLDVGLGGDLTGHVDQAGGDHGLDGDAAARVLREHGVEDRVGDLVADLVRVTLGDGLGREQACRHSVSFGAADADGAGGLRAAATGTAARPRECTWSEDLLDGIPHCGGDHLLGRRPGVDTWLDPSRRMWTVLSSWPKVLSAPTSLTTSRSQPLRASLSRPWARTPPCSSPVSAANPTMTGLASCRATRPARRGCRGCGPARSWAQRRPPWYPGRRTSS